MRVYTKTGDAGETGLIGNVRVRKDDPRIHAIGEVDELNALLGWAKVSLSREYAPLLDRVQHALFSVGSKLAATDASALPHGPDVSLSQELEASMDAMTATLAPLKNFILPGGSETAARLHLARTVCRRAERSVIALGSDSIEMTNILILLNRLSDWLFVLARNANSDAGVEDTIWKST
jgi:cob(I)alamin adenosyltransferase